MKTLISLFLMTGLTLFAADLSGKWSGKFDITTSEGDSHPDTAVIQLKLDGSSVTGTAGPNEDEQWPIQKGKLENGKLTFEVVPQHEGAAADALIVFDLTFDGETIKGKASGHDGETKLNADVELKRAG